MPNPYIAENLPLKSIPWADPITLIGKANAALARYDGILQSIVNPAVLLSPLILEARSESEMALKARELGLLD